VLSAPNRLTRGEDLRRVSRQGVRAGGEALVVHLLRSATSSPPQVGFVVGRAVGNSVTRHHVIRQLRHLCRDRLGGLPAGSRLVVRALPPAAATPYQELGAELDRCLQRALGSRRASGPGTVS
jgi:ribonuclease P protein component